MIDLHLHLDGSLTAGEIWYLAQKQGISLPAKSESELRDNIVLPPDCESLNDYLRVFDITLLVLQSAEAIAYATEQLVMRLHSLGLLYVEIRFAPQLHTRNGLTQEAVVDAVISGMNTALTRCRGSIKAQLILCCMRLEGNEEANLQTVKVAEKKLRQGVCAIDLAGAEALFATKQYRKLFELAQHMQLPFTIHAGEADGADSVKAAIEFGAKRIGHGVRSIEDETVMRILAEKGTVLELCPTSNLQTKAVKSIKEYPLSAFLHNGIVATINSDNMTVSDTDVFQEFKLLECEAGLSKEDKEKLLKNAARAAFLSEKEKSALLGLLQAKMALI